MSVLAPMALMLSAHALAALNGLQSLCRSYPQTCPGPAAPQWKEISYSHVRMPGAWRFIVGHMATMDHDTCSLRFEVDSVNLICRHSAPHPKSNLAHRPVAGPFETDVLIKHKKTRSILLAY